MIQHNAYKNNDLKDSDYNNIITIIGLLQTMIQDFQDLDLKEEDVKQLIVLFKNLLNK